MAKDKKLSKNQKDKIEKAVLTVKIQNLELELSKARSNAEYWEKMWDNTLEGRLHKLTLQMEDYDLRICESGH